jgi:choline/glycine/proline betaine transport protein
MGLNAGIKRLSELNIAFAVLLLIGVLIAGPTILILAGTLESLGIYMSELVSKTFTLYAYDPTDWLGGWTIFYWGWWLSWSPFVGLFIARISRGRTIREFTLGAILVPCGFTLLWMGVFGNSAIDLILNQGATELATARSRRTRRWLFSSFWSICPSRRFWQDRQPGHGGGVLRHLGGQRRPGAEHALRPRSR